MLYFAYLTQYLVVWTPIPRPSELEYEVDGGLWGSMDRVGFVGFDL